jgi:hypothetical protein
VRDERSEDDARRQAGVPAEAHETEAPALAAQASAALAAGDYEPDEQPQWEAVHVFGTAQGVGRRSMRGGTAGAVLAAPRAPFNRKSAS